MKWDADLVIRSATDWNTFATNVNNGTESYEGKIVKLAADISVTTMVGTVSGSTLGRAFCGTFDGSGHTLNVSISDTNNRGTAPFRYISNATIKNLKTTGTVTGNRHCSGLVGFAAGSTTNSIQNCEVAVSVVCNDSHCGGILGHGITSTTTIRNCLFSGSISGATTATGIIYGWGDDGTHTIVNCLANGTYTNCSGLDIIKKKGTYTVTNCYKTQNIGSLGTYTTATGEALRALLGDGWEVNGSNVVPKMVSDLENPVFSGVTISNTIANISTQYVDFVGTYSPVVYNDEDRSVLFLGGSSTLYYPDGTDVTTIGACRAYFQLNGITASPTPSQGGENIRAFVLNFGDENTQGISDASRLNDKGEMINDKEAGAWYTLDGRRVQTSNIKLQTSKLKKGLYIHNGRKVVIK